MIDPSTLLASVACILRGDPGLCSLAPNWAATDARAHVFVGQPPAAAANAGRAPCLVLALAELGQSPVRQGDRRDAVTTVALRIRCVAQRPPAACLAERVAAALSTEAARHLDDPGHVLGVAIEAGAPERLGTCEAIDLRLIIRILTEPGA